MEKSTHTSEYKALQAELRTIRKAAGLSQRDLAARLKVAPSWVAKVEAGERRIDIVELCRLASACDADVSRTLGRVVRGITSHQKRRSAGGRAK
jgi:transcriptional regulator with XRE-family HTH domain